MIDVNGDKRITRDEFLQAAREALRDEARSKTLTDNLEAR
jgi:hypothetical protein